MNSHVTKHHEGTGASLQLGGHPQNILTKKGTPIVCQLMQYLCQLLHVWHLHVLVYYSPTDGLVEGFKQILKHMLCQAINMEGCNWDILLQYIHWQYWLLTFILHEAPATFQQLMDIFLCPHCAYAVYLADVPPFVHLQDQLYYLHRDHTKKGEII